MRRTALLGTALGLALMLPGCADFGDFIGDTSSYGNNPNAPIGDSSVMRRVSALDSPERPLQTEPGNIWPKPEELLPSLTDFRVRQGAVPNVPPARRNGIPPGGPATPGAPASGGIVVPNGNGTSTVIRPDGSVTTIPTPH